MELISGNSYMKTGRCLIGKVTNCKFVVCEFESHSALKMKELFQVDIAKAISARLDMVTYFTIENVYLNSLDSEPNFCSLCANHKIQKFLHFSLGR